MIKFTKHILIITAGVLLLLSIILLSINRYSLKVKDTSLVETEVAMDAQSFVDLVQGDDAVISRTLLEKAIEIKGTIKKVVYRDGVASVIITASDKNCIACQMQKNQKEMVSKMKIGDTIIVKGIYKGVLLDAILLQCLVLNE